MSLKYMVDKISDMYKSNTGSSSQDIGDRQYNLFCEQYLEEPVISGEYKMEISPTTCTIKGIPVIDDY